MKNSIAAIQQTRNLLLISILIFSTMANAQWTQMGPGAGGQERALYIYHKSTTDNDVYVGSDVSGVWRAPAISDADLINPNSYNYTYISNHRIFRFMNKFYRADEGTNNYLFCLNRGGIDRIELDNAGNMTAVQVLTNGLPITGLANSWVSDMHVTASNGQTYFITGNTRTSDPGPGNNKANNVQDIYMGNILAGYNTINVTKRKSLYMLPDGQDVYCLYVDENNNSNASDDLIFIGAQNGLHIFTQPVLATGPNNNPLPLQTKMADPTNVTFLDYRLTSLRLISKVGTDYTFLATINGLDDGTGFGGLYTVIYHGNNTVTWQIYSTTLIGDNQNATPTTAQYDNPHFNQTLEVPGGYLVFNETNLEHLPLVTDPNYFVGAFYFPASSGIPTGGSTALTTWGTANDWGWNNSKPCSNINGCTITNNGLLLVGKSGNIFASKAAVSGASVDWQQIYTTETALTSCTGKFEYANHGYVNTANKTVFPQTEDDVWLGQADRLIWNSTNGASTFTEVKLNNNINTPCIYEIDTTNVQNLGLPVEVEGREYNFSDCFFVAENNADPNDNFLYASMSSGFASNIGRGAVVRRQKNDPVSTRWVPYGSNLLAGDASKMLFDNKGNHFLLVNQIQTVGPVLKKLYWLNTNNLWEETTMNLAPATQVVDAVMAPDGDKLFLILDVNGTKTFEVWTGSTNVWMVSCSNTVGNNTALIPKILTMMPYGANNQYYKILCGTTPNSLTVLDNNLYEVYDSQHPTLCAGTSVTSTLPDIFIKLNNDLLDNTDEGVTAIDVNASTHTIYAATVHFDNTLTPQVKSHLYAGTYNFYDGIINTGSWTDITGTLPNKTLTSINTHGSDGCNAYLFGCLRGLGPWKLDLPAPPTFNQNYFDNNPLITGTGSITENIVINAITNINAANINIEAGYTITVNGGTLNIDNGSHLYSCGNMWQGIINNGGTVHIQESLIEDAEEALRMAAPNSIADIQYSTFNKNYKNFVLQDNDFSASSFLGNTFECTTPLKTPHPQSYEVTESHFELTNVTGITIGGTNIIANQNIFRDANYAIYANNSSCDIENNRFINIGNNEPGVFQVYAAINGIESGTINTGNVNPNSFSNCATGVLMLGDVNSHMVNNTFAGCEYGVAVNHNYYGIARTVGNTFTNCEYAIQYFEISDGAQAYISNNTIIGGVDAGGTPINNVGIDFIQINKVYPIIEITENIISDYPICIFANYLSGNAAGRPLISDNTMNFNFDIAAAGSQNYTGLLAQRCNGMLVSRNVCAWPNGPTDPSTYTNNLEAYFFEYCINSHIGNNAAINTKTGFVMFDDCANTYLVCNTIDNCLPGIDLSGLIALPDHGTCYSLNNEWYGSNYTGGSASPYNKILGTAATPQIDWVYDVVTANDPAPFYPPQMINPVISSCVPQFSPCVTDDDDEYSMQSNYLGKIVGDSLTFTENEEENKYKSIDYAYQTMKQDSNLINNTAKQQFMTQTEQSNIGLLSEVSDSMTSGNALTASYINTVIVDTNLIEENAKTVNAIAITYLQTGAMSSVDTASLMYIAYQNPIYGGNAIYHARALLRLKIKDYYTSTARQKSNSIDYTFADANDFEIYPTPTNQWLFVKSNSNTNYIAALEIYNAQGKLVNAFTINNFNKYMIDIAQYPAGNYSLNIKDNTGVQTVKQFIISK